MKTLAIVLALAGTTFALQDAFKKRDKKDRQEYAGTFVCIGCTLERQDGGADSQCTLHAKHALGFRMEDGTLWTFVDNERGHGVITHPKLRDKEAKVLGWKFPKAQYLEISKFQLKGGDKWTAWDYCRNCGWESGCENQDHDLCEGCRK